ncbi:MAG: hypothetical protein KDI68_07585, partial [Gammaproteobacteria bacterium]|nr:hypothetical protein [Gammaproteobacteria bacterium]
MTRKNSILLFSTVLLLAVSSAPAARSTPVTVQNTDANPVPVYSIRQPYQLVFSLFAAPGTVEDCNPVPVPAGMTLTITSIGMDVGV